MNTVDSIEGHPIRKRFGQHFLHDTHIIEAIVRSLNIQPEDHLLEIGPGLGALTYPLLSKTNHLVAIERDRDLAERLRTSIQTNHKLHLIEGDALTTDYRQLANGLRLRIIGNLPYNISTPLLFVLMQQTEAIHDMTFMLQKEVVERMTAVPGNRHYGRLSIMIQYHCQAQYLFEVPPESFIPQPKVISAIIRLIPRPFAPPALNFSTLQQLVTQVFSQRRKTIRTILKAQIPLSIMHELNIDPSMRPESLSIDDFVRLSNWQTSRQEAH